MLFHFFAESEKKEKKWFMRCNIELCVCLIGEKRKYRVKRHGCIGIDGLECCLV